MKINVCSDLHLEFADLELPGGDVLIISGDVCEAKVVQPGMYNPNLVMLPHENKLHRPDRFNRFFIEECSKKYAQVIYVMGNHEFYNGNFQKVWSHLVGQMPDNVHLLEDETYDIDDITFVGSTLWTDMNASDPLTMLHTSQSMNDYHYITMFNEAKNAYHKLIPEHTVKTHHKSREFIKQTVEQDPTRKYVVVTHHAPTKASVKPRYAGDAITNGAYSSDLSEFILDHPQIKLWTHGHTHDVFDYTVGETRIICNPRGYAGYEQRASAFNPSEFEIEL
jgi:Icc-related predicted phosphoesterase